MTRKRPAKKAAARFVNEKGPINEEGYLHDHEHPEFQARFANMLSCLNMNATKLLEFPEVVKGALMKFCTETGFDKDTVYEQVAQWRLDIKLVEASRSRASSVLFWLHLFVGAREARTGPPSGPQESRREALA